MIPLVGSNRNFPLAIIYQVGARRHPVLQIIAVAGRRLLSRRKLRIPDAALAGRGKMAGRHVKGMAVRRTACRDHSRAAAQGKKGSSQEGPPVQRRAFGSHADSAIRQLHFRRNLEVRGTRFMSCSVGVGRRVALRGASQKASNRPGAGMGQTRGNGLFVDTVKTGRDDDILASALTMRWWRFRQMQLSELIDVSRRRYGIVSRRRGDTSVIETL
jgi:hypothetical protein